MNHLWKGNFYGDLRSVDVHVRHLRQKVEADPSSPVLIRTVRGVGYALAGRSRGRDARPALAGLQVWLVAALVAVGVGASLAILLVVLPTLESSIRSDRAKQEAGRKPAPDPGVSVREAMVEGPGVQPFRPRGAREPIRARTGAEVRVEFRGDGFPGGRVRASAPETQGCCPTSPSRRARRRSCATTGVAAAIAAPVGFGTVTVTAALPLTGVAPELTACGGG